MASTAALMRAIQEGLLSPLAAARMQAVLALLALPDPNQARALLSDHADADADGAVRALARGALVLLAERADPAAASSIAPPKKLAVAFRKLVRDPRPRVRLGALAQVLKYRGGALVELVEDAMAGEEDPDVLSAMMAVLSRAGSPVHLTAIARLAGHADARVAERAVAALAELGRECVQPYLEGLALADARLADAVQAARERLETGGTFAHERRPETTESLAARLTSADPAVRLAALETAAAQMGDEAIEGLVEVLSELDVEPGVADAARALLTGRQERAQAAAPTPASVADLPDLERSWSKLPPRQLAEKRLRARLKHADPQVRLEALAHLSDHPVKALLPVVLERLEGEEAPEVLAALIRTAALLGTEAEVPRLVGHLAHGNPRVVRAAVIALFRLGGEEMLPHVLTLLARPDVRVREQAIAALLRLGPEKLLAYVFTLAKSARAEARTRALTLAERLESPAVEDLVLDMLEREQSDRLALRELELAARVATPRSIGLIWAIRRRRPALGDAFALLVNKLSDRWAIPTDEIRAKGEVFLDEHPELLAPPSAPVAVPAKRAGRWRIFSLPEEIDRTWTAAVVCAGLALSCYWLDIGGTRSLGSGGMTADAERRLMEDASRVAAEPPPPLPEMPPAEYAAALEAVAESYVRGIADPPRDEVVAYERARLKALGITGEPYLDMESRGAVRGPSNRALRDAEGRVLRGDVEGALAVLREALAATEAENVLVRADLACVMARLMVKLGKLGEGRATALLAMGLRKKIVAIRRAATKADGTAVGSYDEELAVDRAAADLTTAFDEAEKRLSSTGSVTGLTPDEERTARSGVVELVRSHAIAPERAEDPKPDARDPR